MWNLFNQEHVIGRVLTRVVDLVILNIVYLLFCLPVVTIGAATSALYYVTVHMADKTDDRPIRDFWKGFRDNFRAITPIWLVVLAYGGLLAVVFAMNGQHLWGSGHAGWIYVVLVAVAVLLVMFCEWVFSLQMRFENTRKQLLKNAALFLVRYLPSLMIIEAANALFLLFIFSSPRYWPVTFICGASLPAMIKGYYFSRIFTKIIAIIQPDALVSDPKAEDESRIAAQEAEENGEQTP